MHLSFQHIPKESLMSNIRRLTVLLVSVLALAACSEDDPGSDDSPQAVMSALDSTNLASNGFPWKGEQPGVLKRWALPIPVKLNNEPRAIAAIDEIEGRLGTIVFDRTSIANQADEQIVRGIIVSVGTSYIPPGSSPCQGAGGVNGGPGFDGGYPDPFLNGAEISARLYVNLDNSGCTASYDVTVHEFGHALGMGAHYGGFGNGGAVSPLFWRVLQIMYSNAIGTPASSIVIP
jgi:hypothetical protein